MMWFVTLLALAAVAWFLIRMVRGRVDSTSAGRDPLEHDRDGLDRPLPAQRAASEGEVEDAARGHVGGHLEEHPGGRPERDATERADDDRDRGPGDGEPRGGGDTTDGGRVDPDMHRVEASVRTQPEAASADPSITDSPGDEAATLRVPGSPDPSDPAPAPRAGTDAAPPDAAAAARRAHETANTGGTGTAVLDGIATAAAVDGETGDSPGSTATRDASETGAAPTAERDEDRALTNPPDPDTAGTLELEGRGTEATAASRDDASPGRADASAAAPRRAVEDAERDGQSVRDNAATNAPIGDATEAEAAREAVDVPAADVAAAAEPAGAPSAPEERANEPQVESAGAGEFRDRSTGARSTLVAGTATLGVGGATGAGEEALLEDGHTPDEQAASLADAGAAGRGERAALADGDARTNVREMMKILNLRDADAARLGISKDDFARLWQRDADASDELVDEVGTRLRRMLG